LNALAVIFFFFSLVKHDVKTLDLVLIFHLCPIVAENTLQKRVVNLRVDEEPKERAVLHGLQVMRLEARHVDNEVSVSSGVSNLFVRAI
jgi:hypothetical protein